jgi:hypothetical protein
VPWIEHELTVAAVRLVAVEVVDSIDHTISRGLLPPPTGCPAGGGSRVLQLTSLGLMNRLRRFHGLHDPHFHDLRGKRALARGAINLVSGVVPLTFPSDIG